MKVKKKKCKLYLNLRPNKNCTARQEEDQGVEADKKVCGTGRHTGFNLNVWAFQNVLLDGR